MSNTSNKINLTLTFVNAKEIERAMISLGKLPKVSINRAVSVGAKSVMKSVKEKTPIFTGNLKKGLIFVKEKHGRKKKSVTQITFDRKMNDIFQKKSKAQMLGKSSPSYKKNQGNKKNAYYPTSVEYGYEHFYYGRYLGYRKGQYFIRRGLYENQGKTIKLMNFTLLKDIEKKWAKGR